MQGQEGKEQAFDRQSVRLFEARVLVCIRDLTSHFIFFATARQRQVQEPSSDLFRDLKETLLTSPNLGNGSKNLLRDH